MQKSTSSLIILGSEEFATLSDPEIIDFCGCFSVVFVLKMIGCFVRLVCASPMLLPEVMPRTTQGFAGVPKCRLIILKIRAVLWQENTAFRHLF